MADRIILVTGSRSWRRTTELGAALDTAAAGADRVVLRHGAAKGADLMAAAYAARRGWTLDPHPADWAAPCGEACRRDHRKFRRDGSDYCPAAGVYRNARMVGLGADVVVAFWRDHSGGTEDLIKRAKRAGIEVVPVLDCACHPGGAA